jgi:5-methylthioadenosine/S-adenosylhomocysteine deaminase
VTSLALRNGWVVTQNAQREVLRADVLAEEGKIAAVGAVRGGADQEIDCTGCVILPGFVNVHGHVANSLLRGVADDVPLEAMLEKAFAVDAKLTRRDVQIGALLSCLEMLKSGTTSFVDLFYWEDEVARAVREAGIRGFLAWTVLDAEFTTQRGTPVKNAEQFVKKHKGQPLVNPMVGVMGVYVCSEETYLAAKDVATREGVPLHGHLSETRKEVYDHEENTGARPIEWLDRIGFLGPEFSAAHCVWVTINEVRTLARRGVGVAHCPASNMKLATGGVAPVPEMHAEGVAVGLGTDSPLSNVGLDMFQEMRVGALMHKASRWDAAVLPAQRMLDLATIDAAKVLRRDREIGSIEVGKRADLCVVDLRRPHTSPFYPANLISQLVYGCRGGDVRATVVDGVVRVADGRVVGVDETEVLSRAQEIAAELFG